MTLPQKCKRMLNHTLPVHFSMIKQQLAMILVVCSLGLSGCVGSSDPMSRSDFEPAGIVPSLRILRGELPDGDRVKSGAAGSYQMEFKIGNRFYTASPATIVKTRQGGMELAFADDLDLLPSGYRVVDNVPANSEVVLVAIKADRAPQHFAVYLQLKGQAQWLRCRTFCRSSTFEEPGKMVVSETRFSKK